MTMNQQTRNELITRRDNFQAALDQLNTVYLDAITTAGTEEYSFNSGDGSQRLKHRDPASLFKQIRELQAQIDHINKILNGTGIVHTKVRRIL